MLFSCCNLHVPTTTPPIRHFPQPKNFLCFESLMKAFTLLRSICSLFLLHADKKILLDAKVRDLTVIGIRMLTHGFYVHTYYLRLSMILPTKRRFSVINTYFSSLQRAEHSLPERFPWHPKQMHVAPLFPVSPQRVCLSSLKQRNC